MGLKDFNDRLVTARKEKGLTQEELAVRIGVTPQAISRWERGTGYPDLELLYFISEILECSTDYLLHRDIPKGKLTESNNEQQGKQLLQSILAEPLTIEAGNGFVKLFSEEYKNQFRRIQLLREKLAVQYGILLPVIRIRDNENLGELEYRFLSYDNVLITKITQPTEEITFQDICNHLEKVCLEHYSKILNRQMVQTLVDNVANKYPAVIKGAIPEKISLSLLQKILSKMVERQKSIRNLVKIIELLEDEVNQSKDINLLTEAILKQL